MKINLADGSISGYDLRLQGTHSEDPNKTITIDSSNNSTPLRIGSKFSVGWDGTFTCNKLNEISNVDNEQGYVINISDNFYVTESGGAGGSSAKFGTGYFGGGYFGGTAARVDPDGESTDPIATVSTDGTIGSSGETVSDIKNYVNNEINAVLSFISSKILPMFNDYYTKTEIDENYYTKTEIDSKLTSTNTAITNLRVSVNNKVNTSTYDSHTHTAYSSGAPTSPPI